MPSSRLRRTTIACVLALALPALNSCASSHLLEWSRGEPSVFSQPDKEETVSVVRPGGTVVALPVFFVWETGFAETIRQLVRAAFGLSRAGAVHTPPAQRVRNVSQP